MRTTKIHKLIVYVYGFNDERLSTQEDVKLLLESTKWDYIIHPHHEKSVEIEEIGDSHPLNNEKVPKETFEMYMDDNLKKLYENKLKADKELEKYKKELFGDLE